MIKTQKIKTRYPFIAFLLSLVCTGLGQVYNGDLAKGLAFGLLRSIPLLLVPLAVLKQKPASCITLFTVLFFISAAISLLSPGEAFVRARRKREIPQKAFNSYTGYGLFALVNAALTAVSAALLISFFSIEKVPDKSPGPAIASGDYILLLRYPFVQYVRGDLVLFDGASIGRIIAIESDRVRYSDNIFYVNGRALILGFIPDDVIRRLSSDSEDIISESSDGKRYPIRFKKSVAIVLDDIGPTVKKGHILIASDSRVEKNFGRMVPANQVRGRVEGVLYSSNMRKILMDPWAKLR
jgi:signal peptidase I